MSHERHQLSARTQGLLFLAYPHMSAAQKDRLAVLAQSWRELKTELDVQERRLARDNTVTLVEPYLAGVGCTSAVCAATGEPAGVNGYSGKHGDTYEDIA